MDTLSNVYQGFCMISNVWFYLMYIPSQIWLPNITDVLGIIDVHNLKSVAFDEAQFDYQRGEWKLTRINSVCTILTIAIEQFIQSQYFVLYASAHTFTSFTVNKSLSKQLVRLDIKWSNSERLD